MRRGRAAAGRADEQRAHGRALLVGLIERAGTPVVVFMSVAARAQGPEFAVQGARA